MQGQCQSDTIMFPFQRKVLMGQLKTPFPFMGEVDSEGKHCP